MIRRLAAAAIATALLSNWQPASAQQTIHETTFPYKLSVKGEEYLRSYSKCAAYYDLLLAGAKTRERYDEIDPYFDLASRTMEGLNGYAKRPVPKKQLILDGARSLLRDTGFARTAKESVETSFGRIAKHPRAVADITRRMEATCQALLFETQADDTLIFDMPESVKEQSRAYKANLKAMRDQSLELEAAEKRTATLLAANDLPGFIADVSKLSAWSRRRVMLKAPCVAARSSSVDVARAVMREAAKPYKSADDDMDLDGCDVARAAVDAGRPDMLSMAIAESAPIEPELLRRLEERPDMKKTALSPAVRKDLFDLIAQAPAARDFDWPDLFADRIEDPFLPWAILEKQGGLMAMKGAGTPALARLVHQTRYTKDPEHRRSGLAQLDRLLAAGVDVQPTQKGSEPLLIDVGCDLELVDRLLAAGVNPNSVDAAGEHSALDGAMACETPGEGVALAKRLIAAGADVNLARNTRPGAARPMLAQLCESGEDPALRAVLVAAGAKVDLVDARGRTAMMDLYSKTPGSVQRMAACGASVDARDASGKTALDHFVAAGAFDAAKALCQVGYGAASVCDAAVARAGADKKSAGTSCVSAEFSPGMPAPNMLYRSQLADGRVVEGRTDAYGRTSVCGPDADMARTSFYR